MFLSCYSLIMPIFESFNGNSIAIGMQYRIFRRLMCSVAVILALPLHGWSQSDDSFLVCGFESVGTLSNGSYAPFWFTSNRQGLSSEKRNSGLMHFSTLGSKQFPNRFSVDYGVDLGIGAGLRSDWIIHQMYVDLNYKCIGLELGMKERWGELKNQNLSTGGLTWSGNSQPIPQLRVGIPDFTRIPVLGGWFSVKGHVSYGRMTDDKWRKSQAESANDGNKYTDGLLFHSKALFIRFGDTDRFPFEATIGLEMYSVFGGTLHNRMLYTDEILEEYRLPSGPSAYKTVLLPFNKVGEQGKENGNNLGSWHLSLDYHGNEWGVRAYYEHFFEDHSSMIGVEYKNDLEGKKSFVNYGFRRNWLDGIWGIEVNLKESSPVRNVVFEVLNTRGQCGPVYKAPVFPVEEGVDGCDGMYNHELYDSYSMSGYAIGSPILLSPVYNKDYSQRFSSNRVLAYHLGVDGGFGAKWDYRALLTHTTHWGTYEDPFNEIQKVSSCLLEGSYRLGDAYSWKIGLSIGMDFNDGDWLGNNTGIMVTLSKLWKVL